jgi:hypothetical protein
VRVDPDTDHRQARRRLREQGQPWRAPDLKTAVRTLSPRDRDLRVGIRSRPRCDHLVVEPSQSDHLTVT